MDRIKLVMVGNGMAGVKCIEEIIALAPERFEITVIGNEPHPNYNRILLSKVLQGGTSMQEIITHPWEWYEARGIRLMAGMTAVRIDTVSKSVELSDGNCIPYDNLILATGSRAFIPPIPGVQKQGVSVFRNLNDCTKLMDAAVTSRSAAVIGGGLLGLEAARGLLHLGMETTVVHNAPYLMNRQLDRAPAEMLKTELEKQGMRFLLDKRTEKIMGNRRVKGLLFTDGTVHQADIIVLAVGIKPRIDLAAGTGLLTNHAFIVDDYMRTNIQDIYAVGECAEHRGIAYGLVAPLFEQGKVLAKVVCGLETGPYTGTVPSAQLKISGIDVFSAGVINRPDTETALLSVDYVRKTYKRIFMTQGKVSGAVLYGDISDSASWLADVKRNTDFALLGHRIEKRARADDPEEMPGASIVCSCNNVTKSVIMQSVQETGNVTLEQVRGHTKASGSCGGCSTAVELIIRHALQQGSTAMQEQQAVCGCGKLTHTQLKAAVERVGAQLQLTCETCRNAAYYYSTLLPARYPLSTAFPASLLNQPAFRLAAKPESGREMDRNAVMLMERISAFIQGLSFPHAFTFTISASPDCPAGVHVSSFGIAGVPYGWELYAGGHAELPLKQAELVACEPSFQRMLEAAEACLQLYRETAYWSEPVWKWIERFGFVQIREQLQMGLYAVNSRGKAT
ncbi:FAD-dependent oxidoreductase [Paenibacillus gansuensis]|uniref:FAD-dependent oxidoreductase n=1 Tax=Paenibacillus gansuensis TaxID=306542 RepID=A0ABW5PH65_9BACL